MATSAPPVHGERLFAEMMRDIMGPCAERSTPLAAASYALGYNLAIEYLADYEKVRGGVGWGAGGFRVWNSKRAERSFFCCYFLLLFMSARRFRRSY